MPKGTIFKILAGLWILLFYALQICSCAGVKFAAPRLDNAIGAPIALLVLIAITGIVLLALIKAIRENWAKYNKSIIREEKIEEYLSKRDSTLKKLLVAIDNRERADQIEEEIYSIRKLEIELAERKTKKQILHIIVQYALLISFFTFACVMHFFFGGES